MIPPDLMAKYGLSPDETALAIEDAITATLSAAFSTEVHVRLGERVEISALRSTSDPDFYAVDPAALSGQLRRQVRQRIEHELEKRQTLRDWERLRCLRGSLVRGEPGKHLPNGDLPVTLQIEDHYRGLILTGLCPCRYLPPQERGPLATGTLKTFFVTSVLPVWERRRAKVLIRLSRTSPALPELLLRQLSGADGLRCRRRIAGAFSEIDTPRPLPREAILAVGRELGERIIVRVLVPQETR